MFLKFRILLPILLALLISGCWDQVEVKNRTIVVGMGVDKIQGNEPILLSVQVINLSTFKSNVQGVSGENSSGGMGTKENQNSVNKGPVIIETSTGKSLYDAIYNFLKYSSRRITFSHNRIVVLGNELAKSGIADIFDDITRNYQIRRTNWVLVAENTAQAILESRTDLGIIPAKELDLMMMNLSENALILPVTINDFLIRFRNDGKTSYAPLVQIEKGTNPFQRILIEKTAIFKNNRLINLLTVDESEGLLWFDTMKKGGSMVFPFKFGGNRKKVSAQILIGNSKIYPRITKDRITMEIFCTGTGTLREMEGFKKNPELIEQIEREIEKLLKDKIERTIQKAQEINADFLGFARVIHGDYPVVWHRIKKDWEQEFPRIKTKVKVQMNIAKSGQ